MPVKYQPDLIFLRHVKTRRIHLFTLVQTICFAAILVVKEIKVTSVAFPLMVSGSRSLCLLHLFIKLMLYMSTKYHRLRGSGSTVVTMTSKVNGKMEILTPCRSENAESTETRIGQND